MAILKPGQLSTGSYSISGSFSGSFQGDGSNLINVPTQSFETGSFATTGSNIFIGTQTIYGNLFMSGSFPLVYNNDSTNNMLYGMFDGSTIYGPYYQLFGNQYPNISQRGGAEFVYDIRNNPDANFHIASFDGSSWTQKFLVNDIGAQITGSLDVTGGITGSLLGTASYADTALYVENAQTASYVLNAVSASYAGVADSVNSLNQNVLVSGSLTVLGGATIYGSSSFTYVTASQLAVSASYISVNVFEPVQRFGGLYVYDSGSSNATASLSWDSLNDRWIYTNASGALYEGGMLLSGPRNTGSIGQEPSLTKWFIPRSDGADHLDNSQIYSSGSIHIVTGSLTVTQGITASLEGTSSWAQNAVTASYVTLAQTASYVTLAQTASYVLNAITSSVAQRVAVPLGSGYTGFVEAQANALDIRHINSGTHIRINSGNTTNFYQVGTFSNGATITPGANSTTYGLIITSGSYPAATLLRVGTNSLVVTGSNIGIGTITPSSRLHVRGTGSSSTTIGLRVENSNASASIVVLDNGNTGFNTSTPTTTVDIQGTTASDGGQLGSELLSTLNWTSTDWTGDFTVGFTHTTGNTSVLSNTLAAVIGNYYQIAYTITGRTAGSVTIAFGGVTISSVTATGASGPKATTTGNLTITPTTDFDGTIVISIKFITPGSALVTMRNSSGTSTNELRASNSNSNTFVGVNAGSRTTTGISNIAFGLNALANNTTGTSNVAIGSSALNLNTTGIGNVALGLSTLLNNTTGASNTAIGQSSLQSATTSANNSAIGYSTLSNLTSGNNNTSLGQNSGRYISAGGNLTTSNNSVFLGTDTRANADSQTNQIVIGYSAIGLGSNTTVIGNSSTTLFRPYGNVAIGKNSATASLDVVGTTRISGSFNTATSGSILTVYGSGSAQPVFTVQGSQGELFSITDSLSGSLFSVNDISGLPILEVFSDNTTLMGSYLDPMLITTTKVTQTNSGSFVVYSLPTSSYDTAFFEYSIKSGSNARAGTIMVIQAGTTVNFTETTTTDIGNTTAVSFTVIVTGSNFALTGSSTTGSWTTKCIIRGI